MDNITHSLVGWSLGQAGLKTRTRKGLAPRVLGANMPDIDGFSGWVGWEPMAMHRGFTHGLVGGVIVMPPLLAPLLWLLDRWQLGHGASFKSGLPMRAGWLLGLAYLATLTHPLMDLLTTYSVQLLSPFSDAWFHADALFIIDVWIWFMLGGAIAWSRILEEQGKSWQRPVQAAIALVIAYIGLNLLISQRATAAVHRWASQRRVDALFASPPPLLSWRRGLAWREADCYRWSRYDPLRGGLGRVSRCTPTQMGDRQVREALRRDPGLRHFLRWSVLPLAEVNRSRCSVTVSIGDARYQDFGARSRLRRETRVPTGVSDC